MMTCGDRSTRTAASRRFSDGAGGSLTRINDSTARLLRPDRSNQPDNGSPQTVYFERSARATIARVLDQAVVAEDPVLTRVLPKAG
jgi:hypothetical protein